MAQDRRDCRRDGLGEGSGRVSTDPFGLPLSHDLMESEGEFDLEQLEPKTRSIGMVMSRPTLGRVGQMGMWDTRPSSVVSKPLGGEKEQALVGKATTTASWGTKVPGATLNPTPAPASTLGSAAVSQSTTARSQSTSTWSAWEQLDSNDAQASLFCQCRLEDVQEPPPLPFDLSVFPIERCHLFTRKAPAALYYEIENALQECGVAYRFEPSKFKFVCEHFSGTNVVKFVTRVFRMDDGRVMVEFQRRSGCCLSCARVMSAVRNRLLLDDTKSSSSGSGSKEPFVTSVTEALAFRGPDNDDDIDADTLAAHLSQLRCCIAESKGETRCELAKVLIPLSRRCPQPMLRDQGFCELVKALSTSGAEDDVRLAAMACVANVAAMLDRAREGDELALLVAWLAQVLQRVVAALSTDKNVHVRREAARALMYMSRDRELEVAIKQVGGVEALRKHAQCVDQTLRGYVLAAASNLVCVC